MNPLLAGLMGRLYREGEESGGGAGGSGGGGGAGAGAGAGGGAAGGAAGAGGSGGAGGAGAGGAGAAGGAGGAGAGGAGGAGGAAAAGGSAGGAAGSGDAGGSESLVEEARRAATGSTPAAIPEKFIVKNAAGEIDHQATALKIAASQAELEKRMGGAGGLPPASPDEYKLELLPGEKDLPKVDEKVNKQFREKAKAMGLTQSQYNQMVRAGNEVIAGLFKDSTEVVRAKARNDLITHYGDEVKMNKALGRAFEAFAAFADERDMAELDQIGDVPVFIRVMERVRAEMSEDKVPNFNPSAAASETAEIERLTKDTKSEYWDKTKPGHAAAVQKVMQWNERQVAQKNRKLA